MWAMGLGPSYLQILQNEFSINTFSLCQLSGMRWEMIQLGLTSSKARAHPGRPGGTQFVWLNPAKQNQASVILDKASALGSKRSG